MTANLPKKFQILALALSLLLTSSLFSSVYAATFSVSPTSGSQVCDTFNVDINLAELAGKQVSGVDIYLNYEPSKLQADSVSHSGGIFTSYPLEQIDSANGQIVIGASASAFSPVSSEGKIVSISFKALGTSGTTSLTFDYTAGSTTDSNITEAGTATDILTSPAAVSYTLAPSGCGTTTTTTTTTPPPSTPTTTSTPKGGPQASPSGTPEGGFTDPTVLLSLLSLLMVSSGIALRIKNRSQTLKNFEKRTLRGL
jgi:hypothetical protein